MTIQVHRNYNDLEQLLKNLAEPNSTVVVKFPSSIKSETLKELKDGVAKVVPGCGCTSYKIDYDQNGIEFNITAPDTNYILTSEAQGHYLKRVTPYIQTDLGDKIEYDIKFYVRNPYKQTDV